MKKHIALAALVMVIYGVLLAMMVLQPWEKEAAPATAAPVSAVSPAPTAVPTHSPTLAAEPTASPKPRGMEIILPEGYVQGEALPVHAAEERDFSISLDPAWFNGSGITHREGRTITFADGGELRVGTEAIFYNTYDGTYEAVSYYGDGSSFTEVLPRPSLASHASYLASAMLSGFPGTEETYRLERTALTHITLAEAQASAEALMSHLGMAGYTCTAAIDMSAERIVEMGGLLKQAIESGQFSTNACRYDDSAVTRADEGYFLQYHKYGTDGDLAMEHGAALYVTAGGTVFAELRERYVQGEVLYTPDRLLTAQEAAALLPGAMAASRWPGSLQAVKRATLTWMPCVEEGRLVMRPIWMLAYTTAESEQKGGEGWAAFDAVTGILRAAIFQDN